jgi:High-temperature-induced dauer-formation protein
MTQGVLKIKDPTEEGEVLFEEGGNEGDIPLQANVVGNKEMERSVPLAEELLDTVLDLLSFSGFAVPASTAQGNEKVTMAIWYAI